MDPSTSTKKADYAGFLRGIGGIVVGALLGWYGFKFLLGQGLYALALPGAIIGMVCGFASGIISRPLAIICGIVAAIEMIALEATYFPFVADPSFSYFLTHIHELRPWSIAMFVFGIIFASWFGLGRPK
jgi:hypothetical protein